MDTENPYQAPSANMPFPTGVVAEGDYEFSDAEERIVEKTGRRVRIWGIVSLVLGVLGLIGGLFALTVASSLLPQKVLIPIIGVLVPVVIVHLAIAGIYIRAGRALEAVAQTEGADLQHLLTGLDKLAGAFRIEVVVTILGLLLGGAFGAGAFSSLMN